MYVAALFRRPGWGRRAGEGGLLGQGAVGKCLCTLEGLARSQGNHGGKSYTPLLPCSQLENECAVQKAFSFCFALSLLPEN